MVISNIIFLPFFVLKLGEGRNLLKFKIHCAVLISRMGKKLPNLFLPRSWGLIWGLDQLDVAGFGTSEAVTSALGM
jgi:hypothetical protein